MRSSDGNVSIELELDTKGFEEEIRQTEEELIRLQKYYEKALTLKGKYKESEEALANLRIQIEKTNNKLVDLRKKQEDIDKEDLLNFRNSVDDVGNSVTNVVSKIGKWALAVFGVRSAYSFVRQSMSTLSQYNEQMATDVEYIRYLLASTLQPVIETLIQLAYKLLTYVGYLAKAWFGVDIFANASADAFKKNKQQIDGANRSAKELQKTLTGFDKANILQDTGETTTGGGGGGITLPSFASMQDIEIPQWLVWIKEHGKLISELLLLIGAAILAVKFNLDLIQLAGIVLIAKGLVSLIKDIKKYLEAPTWQNFLNIIRDIGVVLIGFGVIAGLTTPLGQIVTIIGVLITLISTLIISLTKEKDATDLLTKSKSNLKLAQDNLKTSTDNYINAVDNAEEALRKLKEAEEKTGISGEELYKKVQLGTLDYKNMTQAQKEVYKAYINNKNAQDNLKTSTEQLNNAKKEEQKQSLLTELQVLDEAKSYNEYKRKVVEAFNQGKISAKEARDLISSSMRKMSDDSRKVFMQDLPNDIKNGLDPNKYDSAWTKFKRAWNNFIGGLQSTIHITTTGTTYGGGGRGFATGGIATYKPLKMATGSIINQPGRGVPMSRAIGGEAGAEGIIPLTDETALERIGDTIGKHVKINADITLELESRILARVMKEINSDKSFARNGG